jgi:hypothetical protein
MTVDESNRAYAQELLQRALSKVTDNPVYGVALSPWIVVDGYCATRAVAGTDPSIVANRRAFIEKTPRVLIDPDADNWRNWSQGPKGDDGFDQDSRKWCDEVLLALGAILPDRQRDPAPSIQGSHT